MANHMAEVAKMLGVELEEEFEINYPHGETSIAKLTKTGLHIIYTDVQLGFNGDLELTSLNWLLNDFCTIKRKPLKPQNGMKYWTVRRNGEVCCFIWTRDLLDWYAYKLGNCYRTREEAEANRDKWVTFYASDEVLEV